MQSIIRVFVSGVAMFFVGSGCGNKTEFTSSNDEKKARKSGDARPSSEQDEVPIRADPSTTADESDPDKTSDNPGETEEKAPEPEVFKYEREFKTTAIEDSTFKFIPMLGIMEQEFSLTSKYEAKEKNFSQISRPNVSKMYKQGTIGQANTDTLLQSDQGILDILLVIDNSASMKEEQTNLSSKLAPLLQYVKDSDWRIGVVTTDPANGCSRALLKKGDAGIDAAFASAVNAGIAGSGNEQGIRQAVAGLSCATAQFVRPNSTIAVLIVSDEDNCSNGAGCPAPYNSPAHLTDFLKNTLNRKLGSEARIYGLYWDPTKACATGAHRANQYAKAVADTSGTAGSICDADYTTTLLKISQDVATILKADFTLKGTPDAGTVKVKVNNVAKTTGFSIMTNVIRFTEVPPKAASIEVSYTVGAVPLTARYAMGEAPAPGTLKVKLNGNDVLLNDFTIDTGTNEVVFNNMPADNADVNLDYLKNVALLKDFDLGVKVNLSNVKVTVNNIPNVGFTVSAGKLALNSPPIDGAVIQAKFDQLIGPNLEYQIPLMGTMQRKLSGTEKGTTKAVAVTQVDGKIILTEADHVEGKVIVLRYKNETSGKMSIDLPNMPITESITVDSGEILCELGNGIELGDKTLQFSCDFEAETETVIKFKYKKNPISKFLVAELLALKNYKMVVMVNDTATTGYKVSGGLISIDDELPLDSIVKISITAVK